MNKKIRWIVETGIFLALLLVLQFITKSIPLPPPFNQILTGSVVNFVLIASTLMAGFAGGVVVALVSPVLAFLFGIAPSPYIIPVIIIGNFVLILVYYLLLKKTVKFEAVKKYIAWAGTIILAAALKFGVMYLGATYVALPLMADLPEKVKKVIGSMTSVNQLITALIGGFLAMAVVPVVLKAIKKK